MNNLINRIGYIYKITSPSGKIYIGQTINIPHRKSNYKTNKYKGQIKLWNDCKKNNWNPIDNFEIIEELLCGEEKCFLNEREVYWINFYDSFYNGLNCTLGGNGSVGCKHTDESKNKLRLANLGKKHSKKTIEQMRAIKLGKTFSEEHKNKLRNSMIGKNIGKIPTDEAKIKMREAHKKRKPISEETREKLRNVKLGKNRSNETLEKIRLTILKNKSI